ncbi:MAG: KEOPS complex subunit Pcc1 [Candidatus Nanohalobium sp.]
MKTQISIDSEDAETLEEILSPSLESRGKVNLETEAIDDTVEIRVETDGLGPLRGTTDNVFRLTSLAKKIHEV